MTTNIEDVEIKMLGLMFVLFVFYLIGNAFVSAVEETQAAAMNAEASVKRQRNEARRLAEKAVRDEARNRQLDHDYPPCGIA
jgi:hypothetical protein